MRKRTLSTTITTISNHQSLPQYLRTPHSRHTSLTDYPIDFTPTNQASKMRFTIATFLTLSLAPLTLADFNIDLYTSTDCTGDKIGTWTGPEGDGPDTSGSYEWTGHLGSVNINHLGQWNTQLNTNVHCLATSITCCQYAPDCRDGVNLPSSGCYKVDEDITGLGMTFTVCDSACIDTGYKRAARLFGGH
ncbi:hypothetical protein SLS60_005403 [Paraconiothyrium brasiliense]|uniref:Uncharacterized protein n=1 Tax=Paraconiothyrium brasiliense TaxID=300254 RepID=A0ABR3RHH1_9PLEO